MRVSEPRIRTFEVFEILSTLRVYLKSDMDSGIPATIASQYSSNGEALVRKILNLHNCDHVRLVSEDICAIPDSMLSETYSVVLLDADLETEQRRYNFD